MRPDRFGMADDLHVRPDLFVVAEAESDHILLVEDD
jgi:hypothetical protein